MLNQKNNQLEEKRAVIYCRVSTKEQVDEGNSLVTQERICRDYAEKNEYKVSHVFIEKGESAKTADRPELKKLLKFCTSKKGIVNAVISYKVDRISRNIADYSVIRGTLKRYGVEIRSVTEYFEDTPAGRFMENIIANVGQFDNDVRAERCAGGMRDAAIEGRYVWMAPIGYDNVKVNNKVTIAPNEKAPLILKAFELVATGIYSTNEVWDIISKGGLVTRNDKPLARSNFYVLLRNPMYKGIIKKFGKEYPGTFAPIVSAALFDTVQRILSGKKNLISHYLHENPDFPLRRFVSDEKGNTITGYWSKGKRLKYPYYSFKLPRSTVRKEVLEGTFVDLLSKYEFDVGLFEIFKSFLNESLEKIKGSENSHDARLSHINKQIDSLLDMKIGQRINDETFYTKIESLEAARDELTMLSNKKEKYDLNDLLPFVKSALMEPHICWKNSSLSLKQKLQVFYFPQGVIFDGKNCRTPEICSLFKLKSYFEGQMSRRVLSVGIEPTS